MMRPNELAVTQNSPLTAPKHNHNQRYITTLDQKITNIPTNSKYVKKELIDLILATSANRTFLPFKQRHWCSKHNHFLDKHHLTNCNLFTNANACLQFTNLLKSTPLELFNISLQQGIIGDIFHKEIQKYSKTKTIYPINMLFRSNKTYAII